MSETSVVQSRKRKKAKNDRFRKDGLDLFVERSVSDELHELASYMLYGEGTTRVEIETGCYTATLIVKEKTRAEHI
ncbi:MAG TPA: hypothetical protein VMU24_02410 [Candidatus Acidoferrales bacterium]|nr:hypothetical protein [Candidatus Acidoferrales bacterium]